MLERVQYTWKVNSEILQEMKKAKVEDVFVSSTFEQGRIRWRLEAYPNGEDDDSLGSFNLYFRLCAMPSKWERVEISYQMRCIETQRSSTSWTSMKKDGSRGWPNDKMSHRDILNQNSLTFTIDMFIHKILSKKDEKVLYQRFVSLLPQKIKWCIDNEDLLQDMCKAKEDESFESPLCDGMWYLDLIHKGDYFAVYLNLCVLPNGLQKVSASWTVEAKCYSHILNDETKSISMCGDFISNGDAWGETEFISAETVEWCDSLMVSANITFDNYGAKLHWNELLERKEHVLELDQSHYHSLMTTLRALTDKVDRGNDRIDNIQSLLGDLSGRSTDVAGKPKQVAQAQVVINPKLNEMRKDILCINNRLDSINVRFNRHSCKINQIIQYQEEHNSNFEQMTQLIASINSQLKSVQQSIDSENLQHQSATDSKLDEVVQHILSINNQLKSVQQRIESENQQSQSELILSQIAKLTENISSMKRATQIVGIQNTNEVKIWIERIVKLPQYYSVLKEQGFDDMESVQEITMEDLKEMGIDMIGHRRKIMKKVRELNDGQINMIAKEIAVHSTTNSMHQVLECVLPQRDESMILWFHQKSDELRAEVVAKHRLDALESKKEEDDEYIPLIRKYIEVNDAADPQNQKAVLCVGEGSELSDSAMSWQLDIVEKYKVYDHPRLSLENGTFGLRAKKGIATGSVIGEYLGKHWIAEDLDTLYGTKSYNDINKYAFEELVEVKMPRERIRYYQRSEKFEDNEVTEDEDIDMDSNHNMREPPRKKQRKNEEEHTFKIVLDGVSMERKGILCFMNDCRQDIQRQKPSMDDKKHLNVRFVSVYHRGWPRIFGVAVKDIGAGEELLSFYGDYSDVLNQDRKLQIMSNKLRTILAPHGLDCLVNQMT